MIIQKKLPLWAQRGAKMLAHRGRLSGLVLCALDKDCNVIHYAVGEGADLILEKMKNVITPTPPADSSVMANTDAPTVEADKVEADKVTE